MSLSLALCVQLNELSHKAELLVEKPTTAHLQSKVNHDSENTRTKNTYSSTNQRISPTELMRFQRQL